MKDENNKRPTIFPTAQPAVQGDAWKAKQKALAQEALELRRLQAELDAINQAPASTELTDIQRHERNVEKFFAAAPRIVTTPPDIRLFRVRGLKNLLTEKLLTEHFPEDAEIQPHPTDRELLPEGSEGLVVTGEDVLTYVDASKM
jgi:hypothetical protein